MSSSRSFRYRSALATVPAEELVARLVPDQVLNLLQLSDHSPEVVRSPKEDFDTYTFPGKDGTGNYLELRRDDIFAIMQCFYTPPASHQQQLIFRCALRDRQLDGTGKTSRLQVHGNRDRATNRRPHPNSWVAEASIYSWRPQLNGLQRSLSSRGSVFDFIRDPDYYIWKNFDSATFFRLWPRAFKSKRAPWQHSLPIPGAAAAFIRNAAALLKELGYHRLDAVPSWYNVARFFEKQGFQFTYGEHGVIYATLAKTLNENFAHLTIAQQSWLVALQNLPEFEIPADKKLPARWPVTHTNQYWVRMHLDLNPMSAADLDQKPKKG